MSLISKTAGLANRLVIYAASVGAVRKAARAVFALLTPDHDIKMAFSGYSLYVRTPDRLIAALLCKYSLASSLEAEVYGKRIKPGMNVLEIGSNVGLYTLLFSRLAGETGRVTAFEPDPGNFRLLEKNIGANGLKNVVCVGKAVADKAGAARLFISEENRGDNRIFDSGDDRNSVKVETVSIDGLLKPGTRADFIKMDIQGAEYMALLGMERTVRTSPGLVMLCEFSPGLLRKCGSSPAALLRKFSEYGFALNYLDEESHSVRSASPEELLALCPGEKYLNLLLEKRI